ncbi:hypothetical protein G6O69_20460 [Pseudenhygromyxa sp. WMMC2535]|uniref:hypothetical protein n=1 Tax=Pseudenhygromyxa sp. WMMC2535 TaxID=2712867 RepID=UPI0015954917|nr:hypothetical protein [Pseudenhygromyxa sp. WMMC2535]NVB40227.1 hypothetical protein [Pseudenhygromyxa sp. WMMC2535]
MTGRIIQNDSSTDESLEIAPIRDTGEIITTLDIEVDALPVRVEIHDFEQSGTSWTFPEQAVWSRGEGNYAWTEYDHYIEESYETLTFSAVCEEGAAAREKSKQIYIKIKPIVVGPDRS